MMDVTRTAIGTWSGGRFMNFGEPLPDDRFLGLFQHAYKAGIRTFMTADVYGAGAADEMLGKAMAGIPRSSYCLVGAVGHDFYKGQRQGSKGFPRFTDPALRTPKEYADYLRMATEKSLERCKTDYFDVVLLHNPDLAGYTSEAVWTGMNKLKEAKLAHRIGVAPGPANGFSLDLLLCMERFGPLLDWAMIILNPLEPWPGRLCLEGAVQHQVNVITRVVDYGGLFHDDVKPGHAFPAQDHRAFRPAGWVEAGCEKLDRMREIARKHKLTMLQLACVWNLSQPGVKSVIPTYIQEGSAKSIEAKVDEVAALPEVQLTPAELEAIQQIGDNTGCMELKGANPGHTGDPLPDRWSLIPDHTRIAQKWNIQPDRDLVCSHRA